MGAFDKMKKIIYILVFILCLSGCSGKYRDWKEVEIENFGSIKTPEGWTYHIRDNEIYFVDEGVTEIMLENVHLGGYIYGEHYSHSSSKVFPEIEKVEATKGQVYSNSAYRGLKNYYINGEWCEKGHIELHVPEKDAEIYMIAWDDTLSYDDLEKIAKSFVEKF